MSEKALKEKLDILSGKMDDGSVTYVKRRVETARGIAPKTPQKTQEDKDIQLPIIMGSVDGISFNIELIPYPDGGYILDIGALSGSPFKLEIFLENHEVKSLKFKGTSFGFLPVQELQIGIPEFDDRYFVEATDTESVNVFLGNEETREYIANLGEIDKLSVQSRFTKLNYYVESPDTFDADWAYEKLKTLSTLMKKLKSINV
jgi:hypothetical protein